MSTRTHVSDDLTVCTFDIGHNDIALCKGIMYKTAVDFSWVAAKILYAENDNFGSVNLHKNVGVRVLRLLSSKKETG